LKQFFLRLMARWKFLSPCFGLIFWPSSALGVRRVALLIRPPSPFPWTDPAGYVWQTRTHSGLYCLLAAGGLRGGRPLPTPWPGRPANSFLLKRVNRQNTTSGYAPVLSARNPGHDDSSSCPPHPGRPASAAGVFEMRVVPFMLFCFLRKACRWLVLSRWCLQLAPAQSRCCRAPQARPLAIAAACCAGFAWWWIRKERPASWKTSSVW